LLRGRKPAEDVILSGQTWFDTDDRPIEAHGGGMLAVNGIMYWYGENHAHGAGNRIGISCYSSRDLVNWHNEGVVFPKSALPEQYRDTGVAERPKVLWNRNTGKYVMWMHLDNGDYSAANAGVATASSPAGPFHFLRDFRPIVYNYGYHARTRNAEKLLHEPERGNTFRDMALFQDEDGAAYVFYASEDNETMYVARLNSEFTDVQRPPELGRTWARLFVGESREAPAPFKFRNHYYLITSGQTGWTANAADLAVAESILGPWRHLGNPAIGPDSGTTFHSQSAQVIPLPGGNDGTFLYLGDRWNGTHLERSTYVWLPFRVTEQQKVALEYWPGWSLSEFVHSAAPYVTAQR
jgi:beta-xylosidase